MITADRPGLFIDLSPGIYQPETSVKADRKRIPEVHIEKGTQKVLSTQWER